MIIGFHDNNINKYCNNSLAARKAFGAKVEKKLLIRLAELKAAEHLGEISNFPPTRRHKLTGDYSGCYAINLTEKWRLIFYPCDDDGNCIEVSDETSISSIQMIIILEVSNHYGD